MRAIPPLMSDYKHRQGGKHVGSKRGAQIPAREFEPHSVRQATADPAYDCYPALPRPSAARRRSGRRQDDAGARDCAIPGRGVSPPAMHPRSAAFGRHRHFGLRPVRARVQIHAGAGVYEYPARRRDQSRAAPHAEQSAGMHGRATGEHRRCRACAAGGVHGDRHAESDRVPRHVSAAGSPARSLLHAHPARLSGSLVGTEDSGDAA